MGNNRIILNLQSLNFFLLDNSFIKLVNFTLLFEYKDFGLLLKLLLIILIFLDLKPYSEEELTITNFLQPAFRALCINFKESVTLVSKTFFTC